MQRIKRFLQPIFNEFIYGGHLLQKFDNRAWIDNMKLVIKFVIYG